MKQKFLILFRNHLSHIQSSIESRIFAGFSKPINHYYQLTVPNNFTFKASPKEGNILHNKVITSYFIFRIRWQNISSYIPYIFASVLHNNHVAITNIRSRRYQYQSYKQQIHNFSFEGKNEPIEPMVADVSDPNHLESKKIYPALGMSFVMDTEYLAVRLFNGN